MAASPRSLMPSPSALVVSPAPGSVFAPPARFGLCRPADEAVLAVAAAYGAALVLWAAEGASRAPSALQAAAGFGLAVAGSWWLSNTVAHIHIHTPLFRRRRANRAFGLYLTAITGIPQSVWRARHLWHHAGEPAGHAWRGLGRKTAIEGLVIAAAFLLLVWAAGAAFVAGYLPGWALGLGLCGLHGYFEHASPALGQAPGTSYYGRWYNRLWFNDGFHAEHHVCPTRHWSELDQRAADPIPAGVSKRVETSAPVGPAARVGRGSGDGSATGRWSAPGRESRWPPVLRWLEPAGRLANAAACRGLGALERLAEPASPLQRYLLASHESAMSQALAGLGLGPHDAPRVVVVGGGGFPRTLLILARLLPRARIVVLDADAGGLGRAKGLLAASWPGLASGVRFLHATLPTDSPLDADLVITPLAYRGDRQALYREPPAAMALIHDWLWRPRGERSVVVSPLFAKRLNVVLSATLGRQRARRPHRGPQAPASAAALDAPQDGKPVRQTVTAKEAPPDPLPLSVPSA